MANQPTSFRLPFQLGDDVHPQVASALRYAFSGLEDLNSAFVTLNNKLIPAPTPVTPTGGIVIAGSGGVPPITPVPPAGNIGNVNDQTGNVAYILQSSDFGSLIVTEPLVPFALTLNDAVNSPFFTVVENFGTAKITATPNFGLVNGAATWDIIGGQSALIYFSGVDWWVTTLPAYLLGGSTGVGKVVLDSGALLSSPTVFGTMELLPLAVVKCDSGVTFQNFTGTGVTSLPGLQMFANNGAALAGGLVPGNLYRTGADPDTICVTH